jgi:transposase
VNAIQKYELIRPILKHEKTTKQVSKEKNVPLITIYRYLKRFRKGSVLPLVGGTTNGNMENLKDKSHAIHAHSKWLTQKDKDKVIQYKLQHPHLSSRQIAKALTNEGILQVSHNPVANVLENIGLTTPFLSTSHPN